MRHIIGFFLVASVGVVTGCAGYKLQPITPQQASDSHKTAGAKEGYIFYEPAPYLMGGLVAKGTDGKPDQYKFDLVYLPDYTRPYRFTRYEVLAKSNLKIAFENGWKFTGAESSTDSTAAFAALVDLAKSTVAALDRPAGAEPDPIVLYRIDLRADSPQLTKVSFPKAR